ncbi:hypothetical protein [Corynebacterium sp. CCM 9203]|uniref:hypothetical protein n=1 Tax=Corynebacterium sp. CCM 9203 TaxID=3057615 RepID=UPI00352698B8
MIFDKTNLTGEFYFLGFAEDDPLDYLTEVVKAKGGSIGSSLNKNTRVLVVGTDGDDLLKKGDCHVDINRARKRYDIGGPNSVSILSLSAFLCML